VLRTPVAIGLLWPALLAAQSSERPPFFAGERLTYKVRVERMNAGGRGSMTVEGPVMVRGRSAYLLKFDLEAKVGPFKGVDNTESWIDAERLVSLRFHKHEKHVLSTHDESVELYPEARRWELPNGTIGETASDDPLDELSFIYFMRTLPLETDSTYGFNRHFEAGRNPVTVRVTGRDTITTGAGTFRTIVVEMRVKDPRRYKGDGVIRFHLTDDQCRLPVRIESTMPVVGRTVLTLESQSHPRAHLAIAP
jgi:hypothetical protein